MKSRAREGDGSHGIPTWVLDLVRGLISFALGLGLLLWQSQTLTVVIWILALDILMDGIFDILAYFRGRRRQDIGVARLVIGVFSCMAAGLIALAPSTALTVFLYYIAARAAVHGAMDLWELVTSFRQREVSPLLLVRGVLWILASMVLLLAPHAAVNVAVTVFAGFFFLDGLGSFASAAVHTHRITPRQQVSAQRQEDAAALATPPRAVVFVRRSGANGLGHVGWGFEWRTGWFNTGSVENLSQAAFTAPENMDFWTTHTLHPVATMLHQPYGYDEFKVFHVADAHAKGAWRAVVWISRQPYSVVRRNCSDCVYDVLRAYGVEQLMDPAAENVPNRWYDVLPGQSVLIHAGTEVPLDPSRVARRGQLRAQEIQLHIPAHIRAAPPPWRAHGGRAWYEAKQRVRRLTSRTRSYTKTVLARMRTRVPDTVSPSDQRAPLRSP